MFKKNMKEQMDQRSKLAEGYMKKYKRQMQAFERSPLAKVTSLTEDHIINLGRSLQSWDDYVQFCEDDGSITQLGQLPNVALDSLTVNAGASPINLLAAVQPIDEVQGIVYFRDFVAEDTRGNVSAGDKLLSTLAAPDVFPKGYASDTFDLVTVVSDNGGTANYSNIQLNSSMNFPGPIDPQRCILSGTVVFSAGTAVFANVRPDVSTGVFSQMVDVAGTWIGMHGVVNFANTEVTALGFTATPSSGTGNTLVQMSYKSIPESNTDLQKAILVLQTKPINARFFALKTTFGLAEKFMLQKRLNVNIEDECARDLTVTINNEICNTAIGMLSANVPGGSVITWDRTPGTGTSYFEHKMTILDAMADTDAKMVAAAGRGAVNCWVAGRQVAAVLSTLPGFVKVFDDNSFGPHIYGSLNGIPVVRVPYSPVLDDKTLIGIHKGQGNFEAPLVYSPYMPLVVTNTLPMAYNPLQNQKAAAVWAGLDPLITNFIVQMTMTDGSFAY